VVRSTIPWQECLGVTVKETGEILGIGHTKIYDLINEGRLDVVKIDQRTLVTVPSIKRLFASAPTAIGSGPRKRCIA
jgi:hypothetical protein